MAIYTTRTNLKKTLTTCFMNVTNNVLGMLQAVFKEYSKQQFHKCSKNIILNVS